MAPTKIGERLLLSVLLTAFANVASADVTFEELFHVAPVTIKASLGAEKAGIFQAALDDFNCVLNFKAPIHAKVDKNAGLPADGGTSF